MVKQISVDMYAGALVFFRATTVAKSELQAASDAVGIKVSWYECSPEKALEKALQEVYARQGKLIRAAKSKVVEQADETVKVMPSYVVVDERQDDRQNEYKCSRRYWLDPVSFDVWSDDGLENEAVNAKQFQGMVLAAQVGIGMEKIARQAGGFALKDNARIYFLPKSRLTAWHEISQAFAGTGIQFFQANCPADAQTAAAVADNAAVELRARYQAAKEAIAAADATLADSEASKANRTKARNRRAEMMAELERIKADAEGIDAGFAGMLNLTAEIGAEIDTDMALAILATAS